jgi:cytochrome c-type biogenesis protein
MADVSYPAAAFYGLLSFLSPCVLPLVPPYLTYIAGATAEDLAATGTTHRRRNLATALAFVLGFTVVFVLLGASATYAGQLLRAWSRELAILAGLAIMAMGLNFLGVFRIGLFYREARFTARTQPGLAGAFVMGLAFAFGWTPCIGPVLGAILGMASASDSIVRGASLLAVYSLGLGVPFLLAAAAMGPFLRFLSRFKRHLGTVEKVMGMLLVLTGIAFLTGGIERAAYWILEMFPALGRLG